MIRLDATCNERGIERVALIKIDAEGIRVADFARAAGFFRTIEAAARDFVRNRAARLSADGSQGFGTGELHGGYGYRAHDLIDGTTPVNLEAIHHVDDVLFLANAGA